MEQNTSNLFDLQVDPQSSNYLREAAKWGKFLAIVGFILCGIMALMGFFASSIMAAYFNALGVGSYSSGFSVGFLIYFLLIATIWFFPNLFLYRFATRMQVALRNNDQPSLTGSFMNLKSCFKFVGILTIILLAFYLIIIILGVLGATMARY